MTNIHSFSQMKGEPDWLLAYRLLALEQLEHIEEDWVLESFQDHDERGYGVLAQLDNLENLVIQYGNQTVFEQVDQALLDQGVMVLDFYEALETCPDLVQKVLSQSQGTSQQDLLLQAYFNGGVFIYIPSPLEVDLHLHFVFDNTLEEVNIKRVLVLQDQGAELRLKTSHQAFGDLENVQLESLEKVFL